MTTLDETQEAIDRSFAGLSPLEHMVLFEAVLVASRRYPKGFSANEVWDFVPEMYTPRNKLAIGAVLQRMGRVGLIKKTQRRVKSVRTHGSPIFVWTA